VDYYELLIQSIFVMITGLGIVFLFLCLLMAFIRLSYHTVTLLRLEDVQNPHDGGGIDQDLISAITAAVHEYEKDTL